MKDGQGIPRGKYKVAVAQAVIVEQQIPSGRTDVTPLIATKHAHTETSGLEYDIQKPVKDIAIVVEKPEKQQVKPKTKIASGK
ncbi:hypothetical protein FACS189443_4790 [Planctomycetales bacterium]|nr:hypothetical protein FACS189443_4790 [Planctomycetales bacterium]